MKKIIDNFIRKYSPVSCFEFEPNRRVITIDWMAKVKQYGHWEWIAKKERYFVPLPYMYFMQEKGGSLRVFFTKQSITKGRTQLYSASLLPNTADDGSVCLGIERFGLGIGRFDNLIDNIEYYWKSSFAINMSDGFPIERHLAGWIEAESGNDFMNFYKGKLRIASLFSTKWKHEFGCEFSFDSWQRLSEKEFERVWLEPITSRHINETIEGWWHEKGH